MLHAIFQRHHIPPDEVYAKDWRFRKFMYASMELMFEQEDAERKRIESKSKGGRK
jgi:hypothetical protein